MGSPSTASSGKDQINASGIRPNHNAPAGFSQMLYYNEEVSTQRQGKTERPSDQIGKVELVAVRSPTHSTDHETGDTYRKRKHPGCL